MSDDNVQTDLSLTAEINLYYVLILVNGCGTLFDR